MSAYGAKRTLQVLAHRGVVDDQTTNFAPSTGSWTRLWAQGFNCVRVAAGIGLLRGKAMNSARLASQEGKDLENNRWWFVRRALQGVGFLLCAVWLSLHGANAQAQACTQVTVLNHPTVQAFRTNGSTGSCVLPSGITMSWNHVGANRGLTSFGCSSYDPTYGMDGGTMTVTFSSAVNNVGFRCGGSTAAFRNGHRRQRNHAGGTTGSS